MTSTVSTSTSSWRMIEEDTQPQVSTQINIDSASGPDATKSDEAAATFNVDEAMRKLAKMVIVDELPFRCVEGEGLRSFVESIQPLFKVPSRITVARDCMKIFKEEKMKLKKLLQNEMVCITTDTWSSIQNINYMCVTAHWIDSDWNMNKRILNFVQIPSHHGVFIGHAIEMLLLDWGIEKLLTVTVDNVTSNDGAIRHLKTVTKDWKGTVLKHEFLQMRCCAHIMNLIVKEGLDEHKESIQRIRNAIRYVMSSSTRLITFKKCVEKTKINCKQSLCLDVETRWNSTYMMLEVAVKYEKAFMRLKLDDKRYVLYFDRDEVGDDMSEIGSNKRKEKLNTNIGPPNVGDWKYVATLVKFLKLFYNMTLKFSASTHVTSNSFFLEIVSLHSRLLELCNSDDMHMVNMAKRMKVKFDKYWNNLDKMNFLVYVAAVLDPRYKLKYVKYCFEEIYKPYKREPMLERVKETLMRLYDHYNCEINEGSYSSTKSEPPAKYLRVDDNEEDCVKRFTSRIAMRMREDESMENMTEVGRYLAESIENDSDKFDILAWWKVNGSKYPILSRLARDVLAIPVSTVASESTFSTSGRILDPYRSSLSPKIVEALICAQNWIRRKPISNDIRDYLEDIEIFEKIEREVELPEIIVDFNPTTSY